MCLHDLSWSLCIISQMGYFNSSNLWVIDLGSYYKKKLYIKKINIKKLKKLYIKLYKKHYSKKYDCG